ncbi:MAG: hypothetical protein RR319_03720 [Bacteroides sp.]
MKLIAESGSSRTEWCLVEGIYVIEHTFTEGINPFFQTRREISRSIRLQLPKVFFKKKIEKIYFYGAGCSSKEKKEIVSASLVAQFKAPVEANSDLLAAARGLFGNEPGIACILGTGSNSCFYDGENIVKNVRSLGYILGDEGSGAVLGKLFLSDCLKDIAPIALINLFYEKFRITPEEALESVYNRPFPNRFLATFSYFLIENIDNDYVRNLIYCNIKNFFVRNISQYDYRNYPVRFVGSGAKILSKMLREVASEFGIEIKVIEETSMNGLVRYHTQSNQLF